MLVYVCIEILISLYCNALLLCLCAYSVEMNHNIVLR